VALLSVILVVLSSGCSISHKVKDNSVNQKETHFKDNSNEVTNNGEKLVEKVQHVHVVKTDSTFLRIKFDKGGSFDLKNEIAHGVAEVEQSQASSELVRLNALLAERCEILEKRIQIVRDSLEVANEKRDVKTEVSVSVEWWVWFLVGAVLMFASIVVLKKLPQTSWLLIWL
jgi:hypothetical protein